MAVIVYLEGINVIKGSRRGVTFDVSQASWIVKRKPSPTNPSGQARNRTRSILKDCNTFFWALNMGQKALWSTFGGLSGITGPYGANGLQRACAAFFACAVNSFTAGDGFPVAPGPALPIVGVTFTNLLRIDKDTVRATFNPSPAGASKRIYLRQALPGPGVRRWEPFDGYIAQYSPMNPNSTFDFTTKFQHLAGWHGRYWLGTQNSLGGRAVETLFDL